MGLGLIGFIGYGFIGFTSLGLISLIGLISHISLVSLGGFSGIKGCSLAKLIGHISLISFIGFNGWFACARKKKWWWIASFGYSDHNDVFKYCLATAILAAAAEMIPPRHMQAAHGVATMPSATKISNAAIHFYCKYYAHLFVRESLLCDVLLHIAGLNSVFENTLQNATQLFFNRILQMTKYCIMRECESIHLWISLSGDLVFSHQQVIYGFKFPKRFLEISSRDLTLFSILII
jgi:hypothetical protein